MESGKQDFSLEKWYQKIDVNEKIASENTSKKF